MGRHELSAPQHLMCDLIEHTERLFIAGEISGFSIEETSKLIEESRAILICRKCPTFSWMKQ